MEIHDWFQDDVCCTGGGEPGPIGPAGPPATPQNLFETVQIIDGGFAKADNPIDILYLRAGDGIVIAQTGEDEITFSLISMAPPGLQVQNEGSNLGLATVTTLNIVGDAIEATRSPSTNPVVTITSLQQDLFKTIAVAGQANVVADSPADVLTLTGVGVTITTNAGTDTITFTVAETMTGNIIQWRDEGTNLGLPDVSIIDFVGPGVTATRSPSNDPKVTVTIASTAVQYQNEGTNLGLPDATTVNFVGDGIEATRSPGTNPVVTITSSQQDLFKTIAVAGQANVVADSPTDVLTLTGVGVTITTNAGTDTITFTVAEVAGGNIIQWRDEGTNLGLPDVSIIDFVGPGVTATRSPLTDPKVTVTIAPTVVQYQNEGTNLGLPDATTVNFVGDAIEATRSPGTNPVVTITSVRQNLFDTILVDGQDDVVADTPVDQLALVAGSNMEILTDASTDEITFNCNAGRSYVQVFEIADWSSVMAGYRTLTISGTLHGLGEHFSVTLYADLGGDLQLIGIDRVKLTGSDVELRVVDGSEFDGKIVMIRAELPVMMGGFSGMVLPIGP